MADKPLGIICSTIRPNNASSNQRDPVTLDREKPQYLKAIMAFSTSTLVVWLYKGTSTQPNEFAGSVTVCLMTPLTPMLHIVSQASGSRSAANVLTLPPGARAPGSPALAGRTTDHRYCGVVGRTYQFGPAIVRDDLPGDDPELAA